jgi:heme oxygenase (biliverdin-IX-beta and delta-forming)
MLAVVLDDPVRASGRAPSGLRETLRQATAAAHRRLDARFAGFDLASRDGYRRFLEASASALLPLETALERAGVTGLLDDWAQRSRRSAITADLDRLGGAIHPLTEVEPLNRNRMLGTLYVLEGSRLGAGYLLRTIVQSSDPLVAATTAYLGHGAGQHLWRSFLARLEQEAMTPDQAAAAVDGASEAFALFARAAAQA